MLENWYRWRREKDQGEWNGNWAALVKVMFVGLLVQRTIESWLFVSLHHWWEVDLKSEDFLLPCCPSFKLHNVLYISKIYSIVLFCFNLVPFIQRLNGAWLTDLHCPTGMQTIRSPSLFNIVSCSCSAAGGELVAFNQHRHRKLPCVTKTLQTIWKE